MRGRKPKPLALRSLEGNPGKRKMPKSSTNSGVPLLGRRAKKLAKALRDAERRAPADTKTKQEFKGDGNAGIPLCPSWLMPAAKKEWRRILPEMKAMGLLTKIDRTALAQYCQHYARWKQAEQTMTRKEGTTYMSKDGLKSLPHVAIAVKYSALCLRLMVEFGMTPSARARVVADPKGKKKNDWDDILD